MRDGSVWLHCFKGCESKDVIAVLGLDWQDLFEYRFTPERIQGRDVDRERARRDYPTEVAVYEAIEGFKFTALSRPFPSEDLIAAVVGVSRRTVGRCKARLRAWGWLDWRYVFAPRARWWHCVYELKLTWIAPLRKTLLRALDGLRSLALRTPWTRTVAFSETRTAPGHPRAGAHARFHGGQALGGEGGAEPVTVAGCARCGAEVTRRSGRGRRRRYCSNRCRQAAYRRRSGAPRVTDSRG